MAELGPADNGSGDIDFPASWQAVMLHGRVPHQPPGLWGFVNAGAEAAMVGGLAGLVRRDGVVRHALGMPGPRTPR